MSNYVFIESRDPFESCDTQFVAETAAALRQRGNDVTVFLAQNGVLAARRNARAPHLSQLVEAGVRLLADDFSLRERGIEAAELSRGIEVSSVEALAGVLAAENTKAMWH